MGCAASSDRAERRRRGRALGYSEASTTGLLAVRQQGQEAGSVTAAAGRRRGCKVVPEPKEEEPAPALTMPGSPSFRYYCQKTAAVDALVADADADGNDSDGSVRITETSQAPKTNQLTVKGTTKKHTVIEVSKPKEATRWLRFRGLAIVAAAWYNLFSRHSSKTASPPPAAAAAKSHPPCPAPAPAAPTRSHP
ncbi:uncharacterized protein LOC133927768 [Phragmites australis]|uniref:uncharacterized protein LOC133927768 n=1 Tax=Phragmites australis TaxID=29695 RepID=UPI002D79A2F2|nr:uncharacterized protein LOC133927768 [Phragmites australis]